MVKHHTSNSNLSVIGTHQPAEWDSLVKACHHDFYHLSAYHRLAERQGQGEARLIVYNDEPYTILLPILLNPIAPIPGLERSSLIDVTSVYGYAGPIVSPREPSSAVVRDFHVALRDYFRGLGVCSVFTRLHPLFEQATILSGLGVLKALGQTVSIDLMLSPEEQWATFRHGHKYDIKKLRKNSFSCVIDHELLYLEEFISLYTETMARVDATDYYMFDREYFLRLFHLDGVNINLFVCLSEGDVACGGIFTLCNGIVQYHLSGSSGRFLKSASTKLLIDEIRIWASDQGAQVFHLGGGVGSREDSLFSFKTGFSKRRHSYTAWTWIVDDDAYQDLLSARKEYLFARGKQLTSAAFFPAYRSPAKKLSDDE